MPYDIMQFMTRRGLWMLERQCEKGWVAKFARCFSLCMGSLTFPPDPSVRIIITPSSIPGILATPALLYFLSACLVQLQHTYYIRLILLPFTLVSFYHAATGYALGDPWLNTYNQAFVALFFVLSLRVIEWSLSSQPLRKRASFHGGSSDGYTPGGALFSPVLALITRSLDLCIALRGLGWLQDKGGPPPIDPPVETRSTTSLIKFNIQTLRSLLYHLMLLDICLTLIQQFGTLGQPSGGSIYDMNLHLVPRFAKSSWIGFLAGMCIYCMLQTSYDAFTIIFTTLFRQPMADWPPIFDNIWTSTSLAEIWGRRWHQSFRHIFFTYGAAPGQKLLGRPGAVIGAFLISGLLHDWALWAMGKGTDFKRVVGYFLIQGFGIILEAVWRQLWRRRERRDDQPKAGSQVQPDSNGRANGKTLNGHVTAEAPSPSLAKPSNRGRRRGGWGRTWTAFWVIIPTQIMAEAWLSRGMAGVRVLPEGWSPAQWVLSVIFMLKTAVL